MTTEASPASEPSGLPSSSEITEISVSGYKSIRTETKIELRPLTLLAGANSSGKSSIIQPLLMLKQTLDVGFDPGALSISGANVKFTSAPQFLALTGPNDTARFSVGVSFGSGASVSLGFAYRRKRGVLVDVMAYKEQGREVVLTPEMDPDVVRDTIPRDVAELQESSLLGFFSEMMNRDGNPQGWRVEPRWEVMRERCFLLPGIKPVMIRPDGLKWQPPTARSWTPPIVELLEEKLRGLIHLPGLRGNPERAYPVTGLGQSFPGVFQDYAASVMLHWQADRERDKLKLVEAHLAALGLTRQVLARLSNDTQVQLRVKRSKVQADRNWVNVADVGLGVSQTLPVVVALVAASRGQVVFVEQPEIHLHPRAQLALAQVFAEAVRRGVRVIVETHSTLLLLGIQTLVARGELPASDVKLHWFQNNDSGDTIVSSGDLSRAGAFGDWPQDFADVTLGAESRFLDAAEGELLNESKSREND
jgi:hypothetical protein